MSYNPPTNLGSWNFKTKHVQPKQVGQNSLSGNNYISSESIVICAALGIPEGEADNLAAGDLYPIGVMQGAGFNQSKQINRLFEIGSKLPFFIPGRTLIDVNLSRVVFNGDTLMAALYHADGGDGTRDWDVSPGAIITQGGQTNQRFYINLASELFNKGIDFAIVLRDSEDEPAGAILFRECFISTHRMGLSANQTIVAESINMSCKKIEPVNIAIAATS